MKPKRVRIFLAIILFIVAAVAIMTARFVLTFLPYILIFGSIGAFILGGIYTAISNLHQRKLLETLFVEMDAPIYIKENLARIERRERKKRPAPYDKANLAVGYFANGQFQKAIETLYAAQAELNFPNAAFTLVLHCNFLTIYLFINKMDQADYHRQEIASRGNYRNFRRYQYALTEYEVAHMMRNGSYDEAVSYYNGIFNAAKSLPYQKALAMFMLALAYEDKGDKMQRDKALSYVSQNGNRLVFAKLARDAQCSSSQTLRDRIGELSVGI